MTNVFPHLSWFISQTGIPYLYRRDTQRSDKPYDNHIPYATAAEACEAAGIELENFIRTR